MKNESSILKEYILKPPFEISLAVVGLEANNSDKSILKYFNFLQKMFLPLPHFLFMQNHFLKSLKS